MKLMKWLEFDRRQTTAYKEAEAWYDSITPTESDWLDSDVKEHLSPDFLVEFAKSEYEEAKERYDLMDAKSENMFRFSIGLAGSSFIAIKLMSSATSVSSWSLATCLTFLVPVLIMVIARKPTTISGTFGTHTLYKGMHELTAQYSKKKVAASFRLAAVGISVVTDRKAELIKWATVFLVVAILTFSANVILSSFFLSVRPSYVGIL